MLELLKGLNIEDFYSIYHEKLELASVAGQQIIKDVIICNEQFFLI